MSANVITAQNLRENYNSVIEAVADAALNKAIEHFASYVDEEGKKLNFNFEDICNTLTNAAQLARRNFVAQSNQG